MRKLASTRDTQTGSFIRARVKRMSKGERERENKKYKFSQLQCEWNTTKERNIKGENEENEKTIEKERLCKLCTKESRSFSALLKGLSFLNATKEDSSSTLSLSRSV